MSGERRRFSLESLWPRRIGWQIAIAAACLLLGIAAGTAIPNRRTDAGEIAALRHEVENTRELVALSLLNQQSAASRLRGIDYSLRLPALEPNVVSALVAAVNRDPNVNVRLAAIDALSRAADNARVRQALAASLDAQNSPMVQAALIDYLADSRDPAALPVLRQFSAKPDLNPLVKQHAVQAVWRMDR
jgi:HEAT repeat protein